MKKQFFKKTLVLVIIFALALNTVGVQKAEAWSGANHKSIVESYAVNNLSTAATAVLNDNRKEIMGKMSQVPDTGVYNNSKTMLHGTGNYVQALHFLFNCAQYVRSGNAVDYACNTAYNDVVNKVGADNVSNYLGDLKTATSTMLNTNHLQDINPGIDESNAAVRYFKTLGFALHLIGDVYAHRNVIKKTELVNFTQSHFTNWELFYNTVNNTGDSTYSLFEYRDIKNYLKTGISLTTYEDSTTFATYRFSGAKMKSRDLLEASLTGKGYTTSLVTNLFNSFPSTSAGCKLDSVDTFMSPYIN